MGIEEDDAAETAEEEETAETAEEEEEKVEVESSDGNGDGENGDDGDVNGALDRERKGLAAVDDLQSGARRALPLRRAAGSFEATEQAEARKRSIGVATRM